MNYYFIHLLIQKAYSPELKMADYASVLFACHGLNVLFDQYSTFLKDFITIFNGLGSL